MTIDTVRDVSSETVTAANAVPTTALVDVVLPCLNEAGALPWILTRIPDGYRALVIDNGSTDNSADIARHHGATVITEPRKGFGAAAHTGLLAATAPIVAFCDADASMDPQDLPHLITPLHNNEADLVLGRRRATTHTAWPLHARAANYALARILRHHTGLPLHDLGPMRAARRDHLLALDLHDRRSGYPLEMVLKATQHHLRILELDTPYTPRIGRSKVTGTARGTLQAITDMTRLLKEARA
jgi:glycosyltransferase involved in cell wall biosynthesis